jgi:hypothetical protein
MTSLLTPPREGKLSDGSGCSLSRRYLFSNSRAWRVLRARNLRRPWSSRFPGSLVAARANGARRLRAFTPLPRGKIPGTLRNSSSVRQVRAVKRPKGRAPARSWLGRQVRGFLSPLRGSSRPCIGNPRLKPVETVGYFRSSLTGLWNPCSSVKPVSSVLQQEIVRLRPIFWNVTKRTVNPSPAGTPENSPAIHRWVIARERNESRQGRKNFLPR